MRKWDLSVLMFGVLLGSAAGQDAASIHLVNSRQWAISKAAPDVFLVDFGQVAFGNLLLAPANVNLLGRLRSALARH